MWFILKTALFYLKKKHFRFKIFCKTKKNEN